MLQRIKDISFIDLVLWLFRTVIIIVVVWGTIATIIENPYNTNTGRDRVAGDGTNSKLFIPETCF